MAWIFVLLIVAVFVAGAHALRRDLDDLRRWSGDDEPAQPRTKEHL